MSSGSASKSSRSWSTSGSLRGRGLREDEVDGEAHGGDPRGLLVGHLHAIDVLELLDERVEVQRIGVQVLLEARLLGDPRRIDLQLVREVVADEVEDFVPGHSGNVAPSADGTRRSAPAASSAE